MGGLSTMQAVTIMGSVVLGSESLVGAANVRWGLFLRNVYDETPKFLSDMEAEARRAAPRGEDGDGAAAANALAQLPPEERAAAIQDMVHRLARDVVNGADLPADAPLLESGMDSLSGVEFKNRLQAEFGGIRIPNSAVFDYPTVTSLAGYVGTHFERVPQTSVEAIGDVAGPVSNGHIAEPAADSFPDLLEALNSRTVGTPVFLIPGAGMQASGFRALASLLPVPAYGASWPRGARPREDWPSSLEALAELLLAEVRKIQTKGPYFFAGHSFGATVSLAMAQAAEHAGATVAAVVLLDPRSLVPVAPRLGAQFVAATLADTLGLLSQSATSEGAGYAELLASLATKDEAEHRTHLQQALGEAAFKMVEHVHDTSRWYAGLLAGASEGSRESCVLSARTTAIVAEESWKQTPEREETTAETKARRFQAEVFQDDVVVSSILATMCHEENAPYVCRISGSHFALLHEPQVVATALQLCRAVADAGAL